MLQRAGNEEVSLRYDAIGNLVEWTYPDLGGTARLTRHTVGPRNQVMAVTTTGHPEQTFDYDANGRPVRVVQGGRREARSLYDDLSRLTDVYLDGKHVLTSHHGPMDVDPVHEADTHTPFTAVHQPVASAAFGSLEEMSASFTATQHYRYTCPCANGGNPVNVMGPLSIARSVANSGGTWTYSITKPTGGSASQALPK